jgi:hypothetical protein
MAYFIREMDKNVGPLTFEQLKQHVLIPSTQVWKDGLPGWVPASQLPELHESITNASPPVLKKMGFKKIIEILGSAVLVVVVGTCLIALLRNHSPKYSYQIPPPAVDPEHAYPASYLATSGTYRPNFWQTEEEISGTITNKAMHTNYKDVRIRVNFYSQTKTVIGTQDYIVYQYVPYGSTQNFTIKALKPAATAACGWVVTGATFY